jgi:dephospho-CoA kinase
VAFLLGLTGNIGCGKTTVGQLLASRFGAEYVDADQAVHTLYAAGTPETRAIAARFGDHLLQADGTIDRRQLGDIVMANATALRDLERLLDPGVRRIIDTRLRRSTARAVVLDAIRLIESGLYARCDAVWVVVCDQQLQLARLQATRGFSAQQAAVRVAAQRPIEDKLRHATAVIANNGRIEGLIAEVDAAWTRTVAPYLEPSPTASDAT